MMRPISSKLTLLPFLILSFFQSIHESEACVKPHGIDDGNGVKMSDFNFPEQPLGLFGSTILQILGDLAKLETPVLFHESHCVAAGIYNTAAAFDDKALERFGRKDVSEKRRRCPNFKKFDDHRAVTMAYGILWSVLGCLSPARESVEILAKKWNLDINICPKRKDCNDISTPWGLAYTITQENIEVLKYDGWNQFGNLSAEYNGVPYQDWRDEPYKPDMTNPKSWKPLLEHDGIGFLYRQEHVTSHIGETARSFYLGDEDICRRTLDKPNYNFKHEARLVLKRTAKLNDFTKAEVEYYDSKVTSLLPLQVQQYLRQGISLDSMDFIKTDAIVIASVYEAMIVSWKEKVKHDMIRPTTWIHNNFGDKKVKSYLGPDVGRTGVLEAKDWQPYIRVMPHAEYPSGSSCLCAATKTAMIEAAGYDDVTELLGGPLAEVIKAGSSRYEKGKPKKDLTLTYGSWSEISEVCGRSRLDGGMHFTASVPDGVELCESIGNIVGEYYKKLLRGETPKGAVSIEEALSPPSQSRGCDKYKKKKGGKY